MLNQRERDAGGRAAQAAAFRLLQAAAFIQSCRVLAATPRAKGVRMAGRSIGSHITLPPKKDTPTLATLGISKRESAEGGAATIPAATAGAALADWQAGAGRPPTSTPKGAGASLR